MGTGERRAVNGVRRASAPSGKAGRAEQLRAAAGSAPSDPARAARAGSAGPGGLIVLEGSDGAGKTFQAERLAHWLRSLGHDLVATREPTQGVWGRRYRRWARGEIEATPDEVLGYFVQDRREHVQQGIRPALGRGATVLCDRYTGSTLAYQAAHGVDCALLRERVEVDRLPLPDLVLWLRLAPAEALARLCAGARARYEGDDFLRRVDAEYARLGFVEVDASGSPDQVEPLLRTHVLALLAEPGR